MRSFVLTLFIFGNVLAGQLNITCLTELINADKVKHNEQFGTVAVQHKITNVPDSSIRILRELLAIAGAGDQDQEPASSSSVFVSTLPENSVHALKSHPQPFSPGISPVHPTTFNPATRPLTTTVSSSPKFALVEGNGPMTIPAVITPVETSSIPHARSVNSNPIALTYPPSRTDGPATDDPVDTNKSLMPQSSAVQMAQIISLDVDCAKESMLVKIKFDRPFNGLIYSKGFHSNLDCHHVRYGTNRDFYEFTIRLDTCGSHWVDALTSGKKAYLENVIIIQNQKGIQEIRDISRSICCFWEGLLNKTVSYAFNIDMLDTKNVSFSGDSATASMDVQIGKGPNAPSVNGLVKIGDILTMVVAIEGDPGFDFRVQECIAHDGNRANAVTLSDKNGCVVMNKLMGPWQKTRRTDRSGVSLLSFAFFQAFKFPDQMEVFLECNVELCKNGCDVCPQDANLFDISSRKRRSVNTTASEISDVRLRRSLRVISSDDIAFKPDSHSVVTLTTPDNHQTNEEEEICMPLTNFIGGLVVILIVLVMSCIMTALLCVKIRSIAMGAETIYPLSSTFHSFSSSAFKP